MKSKCICDEIGDSVCRVHPDPSKTVDQQDPIARIRELEDELNTLKEALGPDFLEYLQNPPSKMCIKGTAGCKGEWPEHPCSTRK